MSTTEQILPDLAEYRNRLASAGASQPLPLVPWKEDGLLASLPSPPAERTGWPWNVQTTPFARSQRTWPTITVVTPSFQQGAFLEETIRSVLLQNYPNLEFVIFDGASTDSAAAVIEKYRPWLSFARIAPDNGQAHAINQGLALAGGELRGWLNSDDFYLPGALRRLAESSLHSKANVFHGDGLQLEQADGRLQLQTAPLAHPRYVKFPGLFLSHATFWRVRGQQQPLWEEQQCALDYEFWIRLLPGATIQYLDWPLAVARRHDAAKTFNPRMQQRWSEDAARNGRAHPDLYRSRPWLDREYRVVQRAVRWWRERRAQDKLAAVARECRWNTGPSGNIANGRAVESPT